MSKEFDIREYVPVINRAEFGSPEHIAIVRTPAKSLSFPVENGSKKGVFAIGWDVDFFPDNNHCEARERVFFNGNGLLKIAKELGLVNVSLKIVFPNWWGQDSSGSGLITSWRDHDGFSGFLLWIAWGVDRIYQRFGEQEGLSYSVNHVFLHELYHLHEKLLGQLDYFGHGEEPPLSSDVRVPAEIFARKKMIKIISGRKNLQPLIII